MICSTCKMRWAPHSQGFPDTEPTEEEEVKRRETFDNDDEVYCGCKEEEMMEYAELDPIDPRRCQAEKKMGSFMTFGLPHLIRCDNHPVWVAIEVRDGNFYGGMALCDECRQVCERQMPSIAYQALLHNKEV